MQTIPTQSEYGSISLLALLDRQAIAADRLNRLLSASAILEAQQEVEIIRQAIIARAEPLAKAELDKTGKLSGSKTFVAEPGVKVTGKIDKSVKWDQGKLRDLAAAFDWSTVQKLFKIEFSVPEAVYNSPALSPDIKKAMEAARTTTYRDIKVDVERVAIGS